MKVKEDLKYRKAVYMWRGVEITDCILTLQEIFDIFGECVDDIIIPNKRGLRINLILINKAVWKDYEIHNPQEAIILKRDNGRIYLDLSNCSVEKVKEENKVMEMEGCTLTAHETSDMFDEIVKGIYVHDTFYHGQQDYDGDVPDISDFFRNEEGWHNLNDILNKIEDSGVRVIIPFGLSNKLNNLMIHLSPEDVKIGNRIIDLSFCKFKSIDEDITKPSYYKSLTPEPRKVIRKWGLGFDLGNAVKYISRAGKSGNSKIDDLKKALTYLKFHLEDFELCHICDYSEPGNAEAKEVGESWGLPEELVEVLGQIKGRWIKDAYIKLQFYIEKLEEE